MPTENRDPVLPNGEPQIGCVVKFIPSANFDKSAGFSNILMVPIMGTIIQIHAEHRWYRVEFNKGRRPGCIGHECFKY